jgi:hypothetical protein
VGGGLGARAKTDLANATTNIVRDCALRLPSCIATPPLRRARGCCRCRCPNPRGLAVSVAQPNDCEGGKHNDRRAWGETRCPSQTQTSQDHLGWGVGRWCGLGAGSWPWHWARRVGLGLAAALIDTSALSTLIPHPSSLSTLCFGLRNNQCRVGLLALNVGLRNVGVRGFLERK